MLGCPDTSARRLPMDVITTDGFPAALGFVGLFPLGLALLRLALRRRER